jgi:GT2 family glycosyltransferase
MDANARTFNANRESIVMLSPKVIAVILNWNRPDETRECVRSLRGSDYSNLSVLIVDNGSEPVLYEQMRAELPDVEYLRSEKNLGFAKGSNLGLRYALAHNADYILVMNNDTLVDPYMVSQLVTAAESNPDVGLVGPIIYFLKEPTKVWFAGYRLTHGIYLLRRGPHSSPPIQPVEEVDFVSGCGVLIKRSVLEQIGLFCTDYFMYYEDLDLCFRVKSAGMKIICVTDARMWHAVSSSSGGADSPMKQYHQAKSSLIFYRKYFDGIHFWINILLRFAHAFYTLLKALVLGKFKIGAIGLFLKGIIEGWREPLLEEHKTG